MKDFKIQFLMDRFLKPEREIKVGSIVKIKQETIEERFPLWRFDEDENRFKVDEIDENGYLRLWLLSDTHQSSMANIRPDEVELIE